jgi:hypothetical protein
MDKKIESNTPDKSKIFLAAAKLVVDWENGVPWEINQEKKK